MKVTSACAVAVLAVLTAGCNTVGLQLGDNTFFRTVDARPVIPDDGYFQVRVQTKITDRNHIVTCSNAGARWVQRVDASTVLVSVNDVVGKEAMTIGVDDAKELCDRGTESTCRFSPMQQIPGTNRATTLRVTAANNTFATVKVGQIVTDIASMAALASSVPTVGAGLKSAALAVAATADQIKPNLPDEVTKRLRSGGGFSREINVERLAANETIIVYVKTDQNPPQNFGEIIIDTLFMPSLFSDKADPHDRTNFRGVTSAAILDTVLPDQNKRVREHLREAKKSLDGLAGEARAMGNNDAAKAKFAEVCHLLNDYAYEANFTTRDRTILKWAYLRPMPQFRLATFWPEDCFDEDERKALRSMEFVPLPG